MANFFDIHHHCYKKVNGIFNADFAEEIPLNYFSVGLHPKDITYGFEKDLEKIKEKSLHHRCIALGECGLDALVNVDVAIQEKVFREQILWANEIQKPVIIHCVRKFSFLLKFRKEAKTPLIIHGFNKKERVAKELLAKGFYLSFGKALLYNRALQGIAKDAPLDKIFVETDTWEGDVESIYFQLAEVRNIQVDILKERISSNIKHIFKINNV